MEGEGRKVERGGRGKEDFSREKNLSDFLLWCETTSPWSYKNRRGRVVVVWGHHNGEEKMRKISKDRKKRWRDESKGRKERKISKEMINTDE